MVDIHSHVVWGVDDGPRSMEESLALLELAVRHGTTQIVATPHMNSKYPFDSNLLDERISQLSFASGHSPVLHRGCEFHLSFDNLDRLLEAPTRYTINGTRYLLLECPDAHIGKHTVAVLESLLDNGLVPIIAHPERNPLLREAPDTVRKWVDLGCLVQVTAASITGAFGRSAQAASMRLLESGLVHIAASDCHDQVHRRPGLDEAFAVVGSHFGRDSAELLFFDNPGAVVSGASLPGGVQILAQPATRWFQFWRTSRT